MPEEVAREFQNRFDCQIRELYGLTESSGIGVVNRRSKAYRAGSAGYTYSHTQVQIFDTNERRLPPGEKGEIVIKGPTVMKGYYNLPEKTAETVKSSFKTPEKIIFLDNLPKSTVGKILKRELRDQFEE